MLGVSPRPQARRAQYSARPLPYPRVLRTIMTWGSAAASAGGSIVSSRLLAWDDRAVNESAARRRSAQSSCSAPQPSRWAFVADFAKNSFFRSTSGPATTVDRRPRSSSKRVWTHFHALEIQRIARRYISTSAVGRAPSLRSTRSQIHLRRSFSRRTPATRSGRSRRCEPIDLKDPSARAADASASRSSARSSPAHFHAQNASIAMGSLRGTPISPSRRRRSDTRRRAEIDPWYQSAWRFVDERREARPPARRR